MRDINEIIIHCTATRPDWWASRTSNQKVAEVKKWHTDPAPKGRGWSDIGYHFLIDRDGTIVSGRPIGTVGAHTKGHNTGTIGISLFGGHGGSAGDEFLDNFTEDQEKALRRLIDMLKTQYPTISKISGHNQYASKACPTFSVPAWLEGAGRVDAAPVIEEQAQGRRSVAQSRTVQASVVQGASAIGGAVAAFQALDGTAQIIAVAGCVIIAGLALFIMKERVRKWADGIR